ncbi:MAG: FtsX-like permease family protein [Bacteroidota bacterium]
MLKQNFKFLLRRLWLQRVHTASHLIGLTIGITVCLIIGLFLHYELSFDAYHEKADRIYRVNQVWEDPSGEVEMDYSTSDPLAEALRSEVTALETVAKVYPLDEVQIETSAQKRFMQEGILFAEADFLELFEVEVLQGDAHEALRQPWHTLLTESTAKKFFGSEDPIGKTLELENTKTLTVAGIIKDFPSNTHLSANMLVSYFLDEEYLGINPNSWTFTFGTSTYVLPKEGTELVDLDAPIRAIYDKNLNEKYGKYFTASAKLQPLSTIHFDTQYGEGSAWVEVVHPKWLLFFGIIALIVLTLASINFINLSTAQSLSRAKEVGIRKAIGAAKGHLIRQFLSESALLITIATVLALFITFFTLPAINNSLDKSISFQTLLQPVGILALLGFILITILLTGLYPAWIIAKFKPATTLKTSQEVGDSKNSFLRKTLITTQFAVSGAMLIALIFISQQIALFHQKELGFNKENIITFDVPDLEKIDVLSNQLSQISGVETLTFNSSPPSTLFSSSTVMHEEDFMAEDAEDVKLIFGDDNYSEVFGLQLKAGRFYENADTSAIAAGLPSDQLFPRVLVNEALLSAMNFGTAEEAIGQRFKIGWNNWQPEIVGVLESFITSSLHDAIQPTIIFLAPEHLRRASIKLQAKADLPNTLASIRGIWEDNFPDQIYDYEFLDERIDGYYESESLLFDFFKIFAVLSMLISCIGLWGLATHSATQRTKEIGVRKVLGASVTSIVGLLAKDFVKLVFIALLIAIPIAYYFMNEWLQDFAYRIELQWWVFALAGLAAIGIALLTVSFQSVQAALVNPIESLRNE